MPNTLVPRRASDGTATASVNNGNEKETESEQNEASESIRLENFSNVWSRWNAEFTSLVRQVGKRLLPTICESSGASRSVWRDCDAAAVIGVLKANGRRLNSMSILRSLSGRFTSCAKLANRTQ